MSENVALFHEVFGSGQPIILLHGFPLDRTIWYAAANILKQYKLQVILPDLRGFGRSPVPEGVSTMERMAGDILSLMNGLGIKKAVLAGHSMGGYVALTFLSQYPERISGIAMVASQAGDDTPEKRLSRIRSADEVLEFGTAGIGREMAEKLTKNLDHRAQIEEITRRSTSKGVWGAMMGMADREDMTIFLPTIRVPALVIHGSEDKIIDFEKAEQMNRLLGMGKLVKVDSAGHMPMMEDPKAVAMALLELAQTAASAG